MLEGMKKLLPVLIILFVVLGCKDEAVKENKPVAAASPTPQATLTQIKQIVNLIELVGKSPADVDQKLGKAKSAKKITDESSTLFDEEREYQLPSAADYGLIVRFFKGKAVQFITTVPNSMSNQDAAKFAQSFGFDVSGLKAENYPMITNWQGSINGVEFEKIAAMKISGDNFTNLTVITKRK